MQIPKATRKQWREYREQKKAEKNTMPEASSAEQLLASLQNGLSGKSSEGGLGGTGGGFQFKVKPRVGETDAKDGGALLADGGDESMIKSAGDGFIDSYKNLLTFDPIDYIATISGLQSVYQAFGYASLIYNAVNGDYNSNDYSYGGGYAAGVASQVLIFRKIGNIKGSTVFNSSAFGGSSSLFGRAKLGSFGGTNNGVLNRGKFRIGWSWDNSNKTHNFQPRYGDKYGAKHYSPWFRYKP